MSDVTVRSGRPVKVDGHPGIYKRGNRYLVRYRHHGRPTTKSFRTLSEAKRFKGGVAKGDAPPSTRRMNFRSYADRWVESYTGRTEKGVSEDTRESYRIALNNHAKPFFGTRRLDQIDAQVLGEFVVYLDGKLGTPASVRRNFAAVRALLATAAADGLITSNPAIGFRVVVRDRRKNKPPKHLTPAQTRGILAKIPSEWADMVYLLAVTGLRIGELMNLTWGDIVAVDGKRYIKVSGTKTEASVRQLGLTPEAARRLDARRLGMKRATDSDYVFQARGGVRMNERNWRKRIFKPAAKDAGIAWATPHKLRHGIGTLMANAGLQPSQIAAFLGHADGGALAMSTYSHPDVPNVDWADDMFGGMSAP